MQVLYVFKYLNSKNILLPEYFSLCYEDMVGRSYGILSKRSDVEIAALLKSFDIYLKSDEFNDRFTFELYLDEEVRVIEKDFLVPPYGSMSSFALDRLCYANDKTPLSGMENPSWAEIYAVLTLGLIAYANRDLFYMEERDDLNKEPLLMELCGEYLHEATHVFTLAIYFRDQMKGRGQEIPDQDSKLILERQKIAKKGGEAKSKKYEPLNNEVIRRYKERHSHKNNSQAARDIWRDIPDDMKVGADNRPIILEENAQDRLARWIAKYKRENSTTNI